MKGLVTLSTGSKYRVRLNGIDEREVPARVKGNLRIRGIRTTNPVAVGDHVTLTGWETATDDAPAFITAVEPRTNYIIRRASNLSKEAHIIAANIDQALLVVTLAAPVTATTFIDRFLATAEAYRVPVIIAINKTDLLTDEADGRELIEAVEYLYSSIGYIVVTLSARTGQGVEGLRQLLDGRITLLSGNSGVGKTTLINDLIPGLNLRTAEISAQHLTGMHTTTFSAMYRLPGPAGGYIIDTPGVKGFGTIDFSEAEVGHYFPEIFRASEGCRFGNCTHTHEPGCAVREAVEEGLIAQSRYASYLSILEDPTESKYRAAQ